jgi:hypothetical protein
MHRLQASRAADFIAAVRRAITWRAVAATQVLGVLFALIPWLEQAGTPAQPNLPVSLAQQSSTALFLMLAAFSADEAVRRSWTVLRAFVVALLSASCATALTQWVISLIFSARHSAGDFRTTLGAFVNVGSYWGIVLMVYLNRQSAARLLARVRGGELERAQAERRLIASGLAAVEALIDPAAVSRQLEQVRDLYEAANPAAETKLDALITSLRDKVAQCARVS